MNANEAPEIEFNLFKEAYFGKPYKTRDGRKALYCYKFTDNSHALIVEGDAAKDANTPIIVVLILCIVAGGILFPMYLGRSLKFD